MARLNIDTGTAGNPATGDTLRTAFGKINDNFLELYTDLAATTSSNGNLTNEDTNGDVKIFANGTGIVEIDRLSINNTTISSLDTNADITLTANGTGGIVLQGPVTAGSVATNAISSNGSNADISIQPSGTGGVIFGALKVNGTTISSDDSTQITIAENIQATGTLNVNGVTTLDGVSISDNIITSASSNANLELSAAGTGEVTTDTNLKLISGTPFLKIQRTDNANVPGIDFLGSAGTSGAKILFDGTSGTANELVFQTFTLLGGLAEVFRAQQGGAKVTGTLDVDGGVSITDNKITTSSSNANLELTASGTGAVKVDAILSLPDGSVTDNYLGIGDADDLKMFHNGSHSIIRETGTGSLYIQSDNNVIIGKDSSSETMIKGVADGAVELYHDNTKKFETTANGVSVTGNLAADGSQIDFTSLPTSDPGVAGRLFRSGNDVKISTG